MRKLWLRWTLMAVFVVALVITFINLGEWQLNRLDQRRDRNATVVAHEGAPVVDWTAVFTRDITEEDQWQRVTITGTFDAEHQLQVRYRSNNDATGWELVTPLVAADGRVILIDRGFVTRPGGVDFPKVLPQPPAGEVTIVGYVRRNEQGKPNATTPTEGTVRLINSDAIGAWMGRDLVNGYISLLEITPEQSGDLVPVSPPGLDEGPHLSYALQWFSFTAIAAVGLIILIRNDLVARRKARERAAASATPPGPESSGTPPR